jgi:hypothetical protein
MTPMTTTLGPHRAGQKSVRHAGPPPPVAVVAGLAAAQAVLASLAVVSLPVVIAWALPGAGETHWGQALQIGVDLWLLAHHAGIAVPGGHLGLAPLGLTAVPVAAGWFAGRRLARGLDPRADRIAAGATRLRPAFPPLRALVAFAAGYSILGGILAVLAETASAAPVIPQAVLATAAVSLVSGTWGAVSYRFGGPRAAVIAVVRRLPGPVRGAVRPALAAVGLQLIAGTIAFLVVAIDGRDRVLTVHRALHPDGVGAVLLWLTQLVLVPDLVVWAAAVLAGPGFVVGIGTSVTPWAVSLAPLPALPVLGALPAAGPLPPAARALLLIPLLAGAAAQSQLNRRAVPVRGRWWRPLVDLFPVAGMAGAGLAVLGWFASGPVGPGRLSVTGPQPVLLGAVFAAEVLVGGVLAWLARSAIVAAVAYLRVRFPEDPAE